MNTEPENDTRGALISDLAMVAAQLERYAADKAPSDHSGDLPNELQEAWQCPALNHLSSSFGLSNFECQVLLLCAGIELDANIAQIVAHFEDDDAPTFGLALAALEGANWGAIAPDSPLRKWRMLHVAPNMPVSSSPLLIDEAILHYLVGHSAIEPSIRALLSTSGETTELSKADNAICDELSMILSKNLLQDPNPSSILLHGGSAAHRRAICKTCSERQGLGLIEVRSHNLPSDLQHLELAVRLIDRQAILDSSLIMLSRSKFVDADPSNLALLRFLELTSMPVLVSSDENLQQMQGSPTFEVGIDPA